MKMDLKETAINTRNWVDLAEDRDYWRALVNVTLNLRVSEAMELLTFFFFFVLGDSACFNQRLSHSILFSDVLEIRLI